MGKKLLRRSMALIALVAFLPPAGASASPEVTHPTGTRLAVGTKFTATSSGTIKLVTTTLNTLVECSSASLTGTLSKNNGTEFEGSVESTSFSGTGAEGECTSTFGGIRFDTNLGNGTPWCLRSASSFVEDEFLIRGGRCSEAARSITLVLTSTTVGTCKYNRANSIKGLFNTDTAEADANLKLRPVFSSDTEFTREEGGIFCPSNFLMEMTFTLETDSIINSPIYIS